MSVTKQTTAKLKAKMLKALEQTLGIVSRAATVAGIERTVHYTWLKEDPDYKHAVENLDDVAIDFAESQLHKRIKNGSDAAIIFFLKTKAKKRGYIERQEISHLDQPVFKMYDARGTNPNEEIDEE